MILTKKVQTFLNENGFNCGTVDGIAGKNTFAAIERMKEALRGKKEGEVEAIIDACKEYGFDDNQTAYVLATVEHETNRTFKPVREAYWLSESWRQKNLRYAPFYGKNICRSKTLLIAGTSL